MSQTSPAFAETTQTPKTCQMGVYIMSLHNFDLPKNSFDADLWLWSVCPSADLQPLKAIDFINAKEVKTSLDDTEQRKNSYWSGMKVNGSFRYNWNVRNFPFDRHILPIIIENGNVTVSDFVYTADEKNSKYDPNITLTNWRINNFTVTQKINQYNTTFGDPDLPETGTSEYSRLYISIYLQRDSIISFFKINIPVYIAFAISLLAYFLDVASGTGLLAGALFAVVVNQQVSGSLLGTVETLTLVDMIHITAMIYILATALVIVYSQLQNRAKEVLPIHRHRRSFSITWISYVVVNMIIIVTAAIAG